jgi:hypothetical protein
MFSIHATVLLPTHFSVPICHTAMMVRRTPSCVTFHLGLARIELKTLFSCTEVGFSNKLGSWFRILPVLPNGKCGVRILTIARSFFLVKSSKSAVGPTKPPTQWVTGVVSQGRKWAWSEVDRSPSRITETNDEWITLLCVCLRDACTENFVISFLLFLGRSLWGRVHL